MQVKRRADKSKHAQEEQWNIVGVLGRLGRCNVDIAGVWLTTTPPVANSTPRVNTALRISTRMLAMAVGQHVWNLAKADLAKASAGGLLLKEKPKSRDRARLTRARTLRTWSWSQKGRWRDAPWKNLCIAVCPRTHDAAGLSTVDGIATGLCRGRAAVVWGAPLAQWSRLALASPTARLARRQSLLRWQKQHPERRTRRRKRVNRQKVLLESIMSTTLRNPRTLWRRPQKQWHQQREQQSQRHHPPRTRKPTLARHRQCQHQVPRTWLPRTRLRPPGQTDVKICTILCWPQL